MCYFSLLLSETAGIFHRSGLSIKRLSPDRLCWWISVRLPRVQMLVSSALLCLTAVCKSYNSSFYLSFCRQSWAICFLALFRDFSDNVDQVKLAMQWHYEEVHRAPLIANPAASGSLVQHCTFLSFWKIGTPYLIFCSMSKQWFSLCITCVNW